MPNKVTVSDAALRQAAEEGMDAFVDIFVDAINASVDGELTAGTAQRQPNNTLGLPHFARRSNGRRLHPTDT